MSDNHVIQFEVPKVPASSKLLAMVEQSARNLVSLFADHEDGINRAMVEGDGDKCTLSHSIVIDLGRNKQTDKLSFSIKGGDEITQTIPNPDEPDLFKDAPLSGFKKTSPPPEPVPEPVKEPAAPAPLLGLPAPILNLPGPTVEEEEAYQQGRAAFAAGQSLDQTPFRTRSAKVKRLREQWVEGWSDAKDALIQDETKKELLQVFWDGRGAFDRADPIDSNPYRSDVESVAALHRSWRDGWISVQGSEAYADDFNVTDCPYSEDLNPEDSKAWRDAFEQAERENGVRSDDQEAEPDSVV